MICPPGGWLEFETLKTNRWKYFAVRGHRCRELRHYLVQDECSQSRQGQLIEISPYDAAVVRQPAEPRDSEKQNRLRYREMIVEPVFAVTRQ